MIRDRLITTNFENSSSFWSDEEDDDDDDEFERLQYLYGIKTRIVWVTNYTNNENFAINVPADDPLHHIIGTALNTTGMESLLADDISLVNKINTLDLSKLNLDDLLLLLYRLQQQTTQMMTTKNSVIASASTTSSSSSSSSSGFIERKPSFQPASPPIPTLHSLSPTLSHAVHSSLSILNEIPSNPHSINRRQSFFTPSNIADVPKQLTTTLSKPISSFHSQNPKHIHSPNDVVAKLLQSFNLRNNNNNIEINSTINPPKYIEHKPQRHSSLIPNYTYQQSEQHKAQLISNLLSSKSFSSNSNNFYR